MSEISKNDLEKLEKMVEKSLENHAEILKIILGIKKYIRWQQVWSTLRFLFIVVPIVLGFIYLPPLIKDALQSYRSLLN